MERFRFSSTESCEELLAGLVDSYLDEAKFVAAKCFTCEDEEGFSWNCVAFDDQSEEIQPGYEQRFLAHLNEKIPHCGV